MVRLTDLGLTIGRRPANPEISFSFASLSIDRRTIATPTYFGGMETSIITKLTRTVLGSDMIIVAGQTGIWTSMSNIKRMRREVSRRHR